MNMVTIDPDNNKYDMGELRLDKEPIVSEEFTVDITSENETKTATSSRDPYRYAGGKNEYKWTASGVAPEHYPLLREYQKSRKSFPVGVYNFDDDGDYEEQGVLKTCRIDSIKRSQGEDGLKLDVEGRLPQSLPARLTRIYVRRILPYTAYRQGVARTVA